MRVRVPQWVPGATTQKSAMCLHTPGARLNPLVEMKRRAAPEFLSALLDADTVEDLPGKWQAAILKAEQSRPKLRVLSGD